MSLDIKHTLGFTAPVHTQTPKPVLHSRQSCNSGALPNILHYMYRSTAGHNVGQRVVCCLAAWDIPHGRNCFNLPCCVSYRCLQTTSFVLSSRRGSTSTSSRARYLWPKHTLRKMTLCGRCLSYYICGILHENPSGSSTGRHCYSR